MLCLNAGCGVDTLVGLCVERSLNMIVGLLGILKAGGAYVPLDPEYPAERLRYMLSDYAAKLLLSLNVICRTSSLRLSAMRHNKVIVNCCVWMLHTLPITPAITRRAKRSRIIWLMLSTLQFYFGQPKGVMIEHHGLYNLARTHIDTFEVHANSHVLQFVS